MENNTPPLPHKHSRKNYLINPKFQWTIIRWMAGLSAITSMVYLASNVVFFQHLKTIGTEQKLPPDALYFKFIEQQQVQMEMIFLITTLCTVALIVSFGIFASHKIAGPIYRMCEHLKTADPKNLSEVKFREGDFFPELSQSFNEFKNRSK